MMGVCKHNYITDVSNPFRYDYYKFSRCTKCNHTTEDIIISKKEYKGWNKTNVDIDEFKYNNRPKY